MKRFLSFAAALSALFVGTGAHAQTLAEEYTLQLVELDDFEGGADFIIAQKRSEALMLFAFQVVELDQFEGGADFVTSQERVQQALFSPRSRAISRSGKPQLVSFDGTHEFLKTSRRLRIWRADVGYTLSVGPDGQVTSCEITEQFRRTYVNQKLCDILSKHHQFEPAQDETATPIASEYTSRMNYLDMRAELEKQ
ncbi:MAG: hypothetical protein AAGK17_07155 [Pseudomonadota bacterium]